MFPRTPSRPPASGLTLRGDPRVKHPLRGADRRRVSSRAAEDRRAAPLRETHRPGSVRRLVSALRAGLYRPLAGDDDRVAYWLGHVRIGVLVSEVASFSVVGYILLTDSPGRQSWPSWPPWRWSSSRAPACSCSRSAR